MAADKMDNAALNNDRKRTFLQAVATVHAGRLMQNPHGRNAAQLVLQSFRDVIEMQRLMIYGAPKEEEVKRPVGKLPELGMGYGRDEFGDRIKEPEHNQRGWTPPK